MTNLTSDDTGAPGPAVRPRPMRADARRNYERLVAAAADAFAAHGTEASLEDIARRAGVGIGTLYRHFPTREALLEALLRTRFEEMQRRAAELSASVAPGEALSRYLRDLTEHSTIYRGLPASVLAAMRDEGSELAAACRGMREAGIVLLRRAQRAGAARSDLDPGDLMLLVTAVAWASEQVSDGAERVDRLLELVLTGVRPR